MYIYICMGICVCMYTNEEREGFIIRIGSCSYVCRESHDLPCANWRAAKAGGVIRSESNSPRMGEWAIIRVQVWVQSQRIRTTDVQGQEKMNVPAKAKTSVCPSPTFLSCPGPQGLNDAHPHRWRWSSLLSLQIPMLISSRDVLTDTPRNSVLLVISTSPSFFPLKLHR